MTQLAFTVQPSTTVAGARITPAVQVTAQDAQGNTVTTYTARVTVAIGTNPSGGKLGGTVMTNAKAGVATFSTLTINKAGAGYTLRATSGILTAATSSPFDITPGLASKLVFTVQPTPTAAGAVIAPAVQVAAQDAFNNVATTFNGSVSVALRSCPTGAILSGTPTATAVSGVATFGDLSVNTSGNCSLKATSGSFTANSVTFVVGPATPNSLEFTVQPSKTKAGVAIAPAVKVTARDQFGNTASGFDGQVVMSIASGPAGASLLGTTTVSAVSGTASFTSLVLQRAEAYALQASATGLTAATSNAFLVVPSAPTHLAFTVQPSTTPAGATITPPVEVTVRDAYDNTVPITGSITLAIGSNPGAGVLSGTTTQSAATGVAMFADLSINNVGSGYTLVATLGNLSTATSAPFDISIVPTQLAFTVQPSNTTAGAMITPVVQVMAIDGQGNRATGFTDTVTVSIGTNPSAGTLAGTTTVTAQGGLATFSNLSIDRAGDGYTLQAASTGLAQGTSSAFSITPAGDSWTALTPMPTRSATLGAAAINGILYAVGGFNSTTGRLATLQAYDPATDTWTTEASMPTARSELGVVAINGILYAVGGYDNGFLNTLEAYDPASDTWTIKAPMPTARANLGVTAIDGILYAVGGNGGAAGQAVEAYDPATDTWTVKASMPTARSEVGVSAINGILYAVGGVTPSDFLTTLEAYDPGTDSWIPKASMPTARSSLGVAATNGALYAVGGYNGTILATLEVYDPAANAWTTKTSLPAGRSNLGVAVINGAVYAVAGYDGNSQVATVEAYRP